MKTCRKCGEIKPISGFFRRAANADGLTHFCKVCSTAYNRDYLAKHPGKHLAAHRIRSKLYVERNRTKRMESMREYRKRNAEKIRAYDARYNAANPWVRVQIKHRYWARKNATTPEKISPVRLDAKLAEYGGLCAYCQDRPHEHWDHVVSLSNGGPHRLDNLVPSCAHCNHTKWSHPWPYPSPPVIVCSPS